MTDENTSQCERGEAEQRQPAESAATATAAGLLDGHRRRGDVVARIGILGARDDVTLHGGGAFLGAGQFEADGCRGTGCEIVEIATDGTPGRFATALIAGGAGQMHARAGTQLEADA